MYWLPKKIVWLRHYTPHHPLCEDFYTTAGSILMISKEDKCINSFNRLEHCRNTDT